MAAEYTLVITEKPSVARAYAKVLAVQNKLDGYLEGNGYIISWCYGHLVQLVMPQDYDEKYRTWKIDDLPIIPVEWKYKVNSKDYIAKQFSAISQLMNRDDVIEILCATDAGREGELIFRLVYQQAGCKKPFRRIWLSSMEDAAIKNAFTNPRPGEDFDRLYDAARCRAQADWIVGMNATRLFSCLYKYCQKTLSIGRVMTPTLAMILEREAEIDRFVPEAFYTVNLRIKGTTFESKHFQTKDAAIQVEKTITEQDLPNNILN